MTEKYFNREEAEQLLPRIKPWLEEARRKKEIVDSLKAEMARATSQVMILGGSIPPYGELTRKKSEHEKATQELLEAVNQIQQTGCVVKDLDVGLVDFPSLLGGEEVYLCWKLGETRIEYWHGLEEGFAGRKSLDDSESPGQPPGPPRLQ